MKKTYRESKKCYPRNAVVGGFLSFCLWGEVAEVIAEKVFPLRGAVDWTFSLERRWLPNDFRDRKGDLRKKRKKDKVLNSTYCYKTPFT